MIMKYRKIKYLLGNKAGLSSNGDKNTISQLSGNIYIWNEQGFNM